MKIKKVEISGFRAFNKVEDATFNFTLDDNQTANFISIYAPNGFGKTSFYDAVEWCMTEQIQRFHKNAPEYTKSALENKKINKENPYFLNHHYSDKQTPGLVKVTTEDQEYPRKLPSSKVYNFKSEGDRPYFKDVMLSQESIDSFIKEVKAEQRYSSFVKSFSNLNHYNTKLQNIEILIDLNASNIKELNTEIKTKGSRQLTIDYKNDGKVLEEINKHIQFIKDKKHPILLINKEVFTDNDYKVLSNSIQAQLSQLPIEIETKKIRLGNINIIYNGVDGDETKNGIVVYFDNRSKTVTIKKQLIDCRKLLKLNIEIIDVNSKIEQNLTKKIELIKIRDSFSDYLLLENKLNVNNNLISELETKNKAVKNDLVKQQENVTGLDLDISKSKITLSANDAKQKNIEPTKKRIEEIKLNIDKIGKLENIESSITIKRTEIKKQEDKLIEIDALIKNVKEAPQTLLGIDILKPYNKTILDIIKLEETNIQNKAKLLTTVTDIEEQKTLNKELLEFVSKGLNIVIKHEHKACPLCSKEYTSFSELSVKIRSNKSFDKYLQNLLTQKTELDLLIASEINEISKQKELVLSEIIKIKDSETIILNGISKDLSFLTESKKQIESLENEIKELQLFFEGLGDVEFLKQLEDNQKTLNEKIIEITKEKEALLIEIKGNEDKIRVNNEDIAKKRVEIKELKTDGKYLTVIQYYNTVLNTDIIDKTLVEKEISRIQTDIDLFRQTIVEFERDASTIRTQLGIEDISTDEIKTIIEHQEKVLLLNQKNIQNYEQTVKSDFNINLTTLDKNEADKQFNDLKETIKLEQLELEELLKHYITVNDLKNQTKSFIDAIKTQNEIKALKKQLVVYEKMNISLNGEKENLQAFLKKRINDFFQTELINSIYKKIDPHPDYVEIKFNCDFSATSPRLQIYTTDKNGNSSVPSLYFSSAQINILSLSIFLARALTAINPETNELIKCIFIDDPIQSMDSINILSFIDLFRSLTVTLDRQIILSTHEENFHLLLQKKIPEKLFKSKFIQFETFGKLEKTH